MNNHICIFLAYEQVDIIKTAFDSNYIDSIDWFIIENKSKNSDKIEEYFETKNLKGYIQFEKNIAANAINLFIKDFYDLLEQYEYITFTDGDFYLHDSKDTFRELIYNIDETDSIISSGTLYQENNYEKKNRIIGIEYYDEYMKNKNDDNIGYIFGLTSNCFITLKRKNLYLLKDVYYIDTNLHWVVGNVNGKWCKNIKNLIYHLTWDLYIEGNEYYQFKKDNFPKIWEITEHSEYRKIV